MDGFISYTRKDRPLLVELLQPQFKLIAQTGGPAFWDDRLIMGGETWAKEIEDAIAAARYFVLLLSPEALVSDYIQKKELPAIRRRVTACDGLIVPVLLRECVWEAFPYLTSLQAIPDGRTQPEAITLWDNKDAATAAMTRQLRAAIERYRTRRAGGTP